MMSHGLEAADALTVIGGRYSVTLLDFLLCGDLDSLESGLTLKMMACTSSFFQFYERCRPGMT